MITISVDDQVNTAKEIVTMMKEMELRDAQINNLQSQAQSFLSVE